jgi:hypothetical protein
LTRAVNNFHSQEHSRSFSAEVAVGSKQEPDERRRRTIMMLGLLLSSTRPPMARRSHVPYCQLNSETNALAIIGGALARIDPSGEGNRWEQVDGGWMLLPKDRTPWAAVHFVGGAGLGSAPQICYDFLLSSVVERAGVAVIATPYDIGTDHWRLSKAVHAAFESGLEACREVSGLSPSAPCFRMGHSLGAKLLVLGETTATTDPSPLTAPLGLLAFNNFGLGDSITLATELLGRVQGNDASRTGATARQVLDAFNMVQQFASVAGIDAGLEVSPTPQETADAVSSSSGFGAPTTIWRFDSDTLDSSDGLLESLPPSAPRTVSVLQGTHLSPVVFKLAANQIDPSLELLIGAQSFAFGSEDACAPLVDAACDWLWPSGMSTPTRVLAGAAEGDDADDDGTVVDAEFVDVNE